MQRIHLLILVVCFSVFAFWGSRDLSLPGLQYDEASHACLTIDMLRPENPFSPSYTLNLFGHPFPFGTDPHTGASKAYLFFPFFRFFGPSVEVQRGVTLLMGSLTLLFCYLFTSRVFGRWSAFWTLLLLSTDSAFIFYAKLDAGPIIEKLMWMTFCLWNFGEWGRSGKYSRLLWGLAGLIIGMYGHIAFVWFVLASLFSLFIFFRREIVTLLGKREWYTIGGALVMMVVFFLYWLIGARDLLALPVLNSGGVVALLERLATQAGIILDVLGDSFQERIRTRPCTDLFFIVSVLFLFIYKRSRPVKFILLLMAALFFQMSFTPGAILPHRIMMLYVFFPLPAGVAVTESFRFFSEKQGRRVLKGIFSGGILFLVALSISGQLLLTREVVQAIRHTGGKGVWSDEIYRLAGYLKEKKKEVVCVDWGFRKNLFLLTKGEILLEEPLWEWQDAQKMEEDLKRMSRGAERGTLFLLHPEVYWVGGYPTVEQFEEIVRQSGATAVRQKTFYEKSGKPVYFVYAIEP